MNSQNLTASLKALRPYVLNVKVVFGVVLIVLALNQGFTQGKQKWQQYQDVLRSNTQLQEKKSSLAHEEAQLNTIAKELDKQHIKVLQIEAGQSPELAAIQIAESVVSMSETYQNAYESLEPKQSIVINVDQAVTLPIGAGSSSSPAPVPGSPPPP